MKIKSLIGTSENVVITQIWVAMIHYLFIAYLKFLHGFKLGMTELTNRISFLSVFDFTFVLNLVTAGGTADFLSEYSDKICKIGEAAFFGNLLAPHGTVYEQRTCLRYAELGEIFKRGTTCDFFKFTQQTVR